MPVTSGRPATPNGGPLLSTEDGDARYQLLDALDVTHPDYGAAGNGVADDTAEIQAALDAVPAQGGTVYFPAGVYKISGTLTASNPTRVIGPGLFEETFNTAYTVTTGAQIRRDSTTGSAFDFQAAGSSIEGMTIVNPSSATVSAGVGVKFTNGAKSMVRRCYIEGFYINVEYVDGDGWTMADNTIVNPWYAAVKIANTDHSDAGDQSVYGNTFQTYGAVARTIPYGVLWVSGGGTRFVSNKWNGGVGGGKFTNALAFVPTPATATGVFLIQGNSIENYGTNGIYIAPGSAADTWALESIRILGNEIARFDNAAGTGIFLNGGTNATLGNIYIADNDVRRALRGIDVDYTDAITLGVNTYEFTPTGIYVGANVTSVPALAGDQVCKSQIAFTVMTCLQSTYTADVDTSKVTPIRVSKDVSLTTSWSDLLLITTQAYEAARVDLVASGLSQSQGIAVRSASWLVYDTGSGSDTATEIGTATTAGSTSVEYQWVVTTTTATLQGRVVAPSTGYDACLHFTVTGLTRGLQRK